MGKGIEIGVASETKAFKQGVETGIIKPLEDAVDQLTELGKAKGPEELEKGLEQAQDASKKLQRETKETADKIESQFRESYRSVARSADTNLDRAKNATRSLKDEALQNFGEVASSFDGTMQGVADGVQGTLGGAAVAIGGAGGVALGLLGAAGGAMLTQIADDAEVAKEKVNDALNDMIASGNNFVSQQFLTQGIKDVLDDPDLSAKAQAWADEIGVPITDVVAALAGVPEAVTKVTDAVEAANQRTAAASDGTREGARLAAAEIDIRNQLVDKIGEQTAAVGTAADKAIIYRAATEALAGSQTAAREAAAKLNEELGKTPPVVRTVAELDTSAIDRALRQSRSLQVEVQLTRNGTPVY